MTRERRPPQRRQFVAPLPLGLGGLFTRMQSARAAQIAAQWRARIPSGPRDWSPVERGPAVAGKPKMDRAARPQPQRMSAITRVSNYSQGGRSQLTGKQVKRVLSKNVMDHPYRRSRVDRRDRVLDLHAALVSPVDALPAPRRVEDVETILL